MQVDVESVRVCLRREDSPIKVECWCKQDCCWFEVNLATLTYWRHYQIANIGVVLYGLSVLFYQLMPTHVSTDFEAKIKKAPYIANIGQN